jgi:hypothetical protein
MYQGYINVSQVLKQVTRNKHHNKPWYSNQLILGDVEDISSLNYRRQILNNSKRYNNNNIKYDNLIAYELSPCLAALL